MLSKVIYLGDLRTESTHLLSNQTVITDAPLDNQGKGEAFSPTDLVTNAVASCMFTIMGIKARELHLDLSGSTAEVYKEMQASPRKISKVKVVFALQGVTTDKDKTILERVALNCPVYLSLNADIEKDITFNWK